MFVQSTPGVILGSRFLSLPGHVVMIGTHIGRESATKHTRLCPTEPPNTGTSLQRIVTALLNQARPLMAIGRGRNQPARVGLGDLPASTWKERLMVVPISRAAAGSCRRGGQPAGRRLGDLSALTWSQSVDSQTRHGAAESQQGKTEKSVFLFLTWSWRPSRRPGVGAAARWCDLKTVNPAFGAALHTGRSMTGGSGTLNSKKIIGGVRRETAKAQDAGNLPPPHTR